MRRIEIYDTTLRDGTQREGISLSVHDKLKIARRLDEFGVDYIEGGWPGSNPKDAAFFEKASEREWSNAKISAFGSTLKKGNRPDDDPNIQAASHLYLTGPDKQERGAFFQGKNKLEEFNPDVLEEFHRKLIDSTLRMNKFVRELKRRKNRFDLISIRKGDARSLPNDLFDTSITSPPYGEEKNTICYSRWSKLSVAWLRLNNQKIKKTENNYLIVQPSIFF